MSKIDDVLEQISAGYQNPQVSFGFMMIDDQHMEQMKLRRKVTGVIQHRICALSVGEIGGQLVTFYGHRLSDCIKKALEWRQLPTKTKRGPRQPKQQAQPQQG